MNEALKKEIIEAEINKYKQYESKGNYVFASIFPSVEHLFLFKKEEEFKSGKSKHFIVVFEKNEIIDFTFKKGFLMNSLVIETQDKKIKLKFSSNAVGLKLQKGNTNKLIENNWRI